MLRLLPLISNCHVDVEGMELNAVTQHMTQWKRIDRELRLLEEPPEEALSTLRRLWAIIILYWLNFYTAPTEKFTNSRPPRVLFGGDAPSAKSGIILAKALKRWKH